MPSSTPTSSRKGSMASAASSSQAEIIYHRPIQVPTDRGPTPTYPAATQTAVGASSASSEARSVQEPSLRLHGASWLEREIAVHTKEYFSVPLTDPAWAIKRYGQFGHLWNTTQSAIGLSRDECQTIDAIIEASIGAGVIPVDGVSDVASTRGSARTGLHLERILYGRLLTGAERSNTTLRPRISQDKPVPTEEEEASGKYSGSRGGSRIDDWDEPEDPRIARLVPLSIVNLSGREFGNKDYNDHWNALLSMFPGDDELREDWQRRSTTNVSTAATN